MPTPEPVAVITGGTGGIGTAISRALAASGFHVVVGYLRSVDLAQSLVAELPGAGHLALCVPVTDSAALNAMTTHVAERYGRCDLLVNCAGTSRFVPHGDLDALDDDLIDDILATNVKGAFAALRALLPLLQESTLPGGGVVVNISSIAARNAVGSNIMYCASKAALDNMTQSLARALAPSVRVLSVAPGLVDTELVQSLDPEWRAQQLARASLGTPTPPADVAAVVVAAVRDPPFVTGCVLSVDEPVR